MANSMRDPITTHVLDATNGLPAPSIPVTLTLVSYTEAFPNTTYTAHTSTDGRITHWTPASDIPTLPERLTEIARVAHEQPSRLEKLVWSLRFNTEVYWGSGKTFYPEVEVKFFVDIEEALRGKGHWHVPVLLGPWSYTTYRGS